MTVLCPWWWHTHDPMMLVAVACLWRCRAHVIGVSLAWCWRGAERVPPSMLITYDDVVKISDFGTSKELIDKSTKMSFAGTVAWMAPEVIRNEPVSEKVDIW